MTFQEIIDVVENWQSLIGAFIGAFIPISFSFWLLRRETRIHHRENIRLLEIRLVNSINDLLNLRGEMELFVKRLGDIIDHIKKSDNSKFDLSTTNFPSHSMEYYASDFEKRTKSLYLANALAKSYFLVKVIHHSISDFREEYKYLVDRNFNLFLSHTQAEIDARSQNAMFASQLTAIKTILEDVILKKNIPIAIKSLLLAKIVLEKYSKPYGFLTRYYYEGLFFGIAKKKNAQELVENRVANEFQKEIGEIENNYKNS